MKSFGVSPCFPPEIYIRPKQENIDESQKEFDWVNDLFSNLAEGVKLAKKCPICELVPKSNKKIEKKIKQHIISRHKIAIYPCKGKFSLKKNCHVTYLRRGRLQLRVALASRISRACRRSAPAAIN